MADFTAILSVSVVIKPKEMGIFGRLIKEIKALLEGVRIYALFSSSLFISFLNPFILEPTARKRSGILFAPKRMTMIKNNIIISVSPKLPMVVLHEF
jgi:hypothetical protein